MVWTSEAFCWIAVPFDPFFLAFGVLLGFCAVGHSTLPAGCISSPRLQGARITLLCIWHYGLGRLLPHFLMRENVVQKLGTPPSLHTEMFSTSKKENKLSSEPFLLFLSLSVSGRGGPRRVTGVGAPYRWVARAVPLNTLSLVVLRQTTTDR